MVLHSVVDASHRRVRCKRIQAGASRGDEVVPNVRTDKFAHDGRQTIAGAGVEFTLGVSERRQVHMVDLVALFGLWVWSGPRAG